MAYLVLMPKSQITEKRRRNSQETEEEGIGRKALWPAHGQAQLVAGLGRKALA